MTNNKNNIKISVDSKEEKGKKVIINISEREKELFSRLIKKYVWKKEVCIWV